MPATIKGPKPSDSDRACCSDCKEAIQQLIENAEDAGWTDGAMANELLELAIAREPRDSDDTEEAHPPSSPTP